MVLRKAMKKHPFFLPFAGCKSRCVYCNQHTISGIVRPPSVKEVIKELTELSEAVEVCFFGGSFCRLEEEIIKGYLDAVVKFAPEGSRIRFSTYPDDLMDENLRNFIFSYPISCVEIGVQTLDPHVLNICRREIEPPQILKSLSDLEEINIPIAVQLMIGLPGQTIKSSVDDIFALAKIKKNREWQMRIYPCLVIENTKLQDMMKESSYTPLSVDDAIKWGGKVADLATSLGFTLIRVGLQESQLLASNVRGGPHHPALGELILAESLINKLLRLNSKGPWYLPRSQRSKLSGHGRYGIKRMAFLTSKSEKEITENLLYFP